MILIVEDDPDLWEVMTVALESEGYDVESAGDGREALDRLRKPMHLSNLLETVERYCG